MLRKVLILIGLALWIFICSSFIYDFFLVTTTTEFLEYFQSRIILSLAIPTLTIYTIWLLTEAVRDWKKKPKKTRIIGR